MLHGILLVMTLITKLRYLFYWFELVFGDWFMTHLTLAYSYRTMNKLVFSQLLVTFSSNT